MKNTLSFLPRNMYAQIAMQALLDMNQFSQKYHLVLSAQDAELLVKKRDHVLQSYRRVEFGGSMLNKLVREFCDSPFLTQDNYEETLEELIEIFYYFKNESLDQISDDELLMAMHHYFDGVCQGSIELLQGRELEELTRSIRYEEEV